MLGALHALLPGAGARLLGATPAIVHSAGVVNANDSTAVALTLPGALPDGLRMLAFAFSRAGQPASWATPPGWTELGQWLGQGGGVNHPFALYERTSAGDGGATVTFAIQDTGNTRLGVVLAIADGAQGAALITTDTAAHEAGSALDHIPHPGVTPPADHTLVLWAGAGRTHELAGDQPLDPAPGFLSLLQDRNAAAGLALYLGYSLEAAGATGSRQRARAGGANRGWGLTVALPAASAGPPAAEYITTLEAHGLTDASDPAQVRAAFAAAIADASAHAHLSSTGRGVVELMPGKVYTCMPEGNGSNSTGSTSDATGIRGAIVINADTPNVELRTQGKPAIDSGNQAILRMDAWAGYSGVRTRCVLRLDVASNVLVGWLEVDGNRLSCGTDFDSRRDWIDNEIIYPVGNGGLMNIVIYGGDGVTLKEVNSHDALVDGLFLRRKSGAADTGTINGLIEDSIFADNRRQGCTVIDVGRSTGTWDQFIFRRTKFLRTGDQASIVGEQPGAGVDIEPLQTSEPIWGLTFDDCDFESNQGSSNEYGNHTSQTPGRGIVSDTNSDINYFKIINCRSTDNRSEAVKLNMRQEADFEHVLIEGLLATGNGTNQMIFDRGGTAVPGLIKDALLIKNDVTAIVFTSHLPPTGHSVTVWKGDFDPTVATNGKQTITTNDGFPG